MADIDTEEVNDFISTMKRSKSDLVKAYDEIKKCMNTEGWEDSNREAFNVAAKGLQSEVDNSISDIENTIKELEKIVEKAERIKY